MSHQQPLPPMDGKFIVDSFVSYVEQLQLLAKKDPKRFDEICRYIDAEITRFGVLHGKTIRNPQPENVQETLNLNRRLSSMYLLISCLKLTR